MARKAVFCIVPDISRASRIVSELQSAGFSNNDISVLMPDKGTTRDFAHEHHTKAPEGIATGAGAISTDGGAAPRHPTSTSASARIGVGADGGASGRIPSHCP